MGLFRSRAPEGEQRAFSESEILAMLNERRTTVPMGASISVTSVDESLHNATVWACIDVLASSVAALPVDAVWERDGARLPVSPQPSLLAEPSAFVSLDVWLYQVMFSMLTDGNAFGRVTATDALSRPTTIELVDPACVGERKVENGRATVRVDHGRPEDLWPYGPIWHVPGKMTRPGSPFALSPMHYAGRVTGTALAAEGYGSEFFAGGGHPTGIVSSETELTAEQAGAIKAAYRNATAGSREVAVFGSGLSYNQIQTAPDDSQFLDLMRFEVEQVCRFYRVPPTMVYGVTSGQSVTYANASQQDLAYLKHSLDGYLVRIERALTLALPKPQTVKFNRDAILRAETVTRYQAHSTGLTAGFLTVDEVREMEDRPPLPAEDEPADEPAPGSPDDMIEDITDAEPSD